MTDLTPEFLVELKALADGSPDWALLSLEAPTVCALVEEVELQRESCHKLATLLQETHQRAQEYEAALREILLAGELGPDSRLPEHFDYTSAPFMHETARKALERQPMTESRFYARKPVVIEAMRFGKPWKAVKEWCPDLTLIIGQSNLVEFAQLRTRPGTIRVAIGDWIVKNDHGIKAGSGTA